MVSNKLIRSSQLQYIILVRGGTWYTTYKTGPVRGIYTCIAGPSQRPGIPDWTKSSRACCDNLAHISQPPKQAKVLC